MPKLQSGTWKRHHPLNGDEMNKSVICIQHLWWCYFILQCICWVEWKYLTNNESWFVNLPVWFCVLIWSWNRWLNEPWQFPNNFDRYWIGTLPYDLTRICKLKPTLESNFDSFTKWESFNGIPNWYRVGDSAYFVTSHSIFAPYLAIKQNLINQIRLAPHCVRRYAVNGRCW